MGERRFTFDYDFDAPARLPVMDEDVVNAAVAAAEEASAEPEPPPPTFSEEDLLLTRASAFEEGRQSGFTEASETIEQAIAATLQSVSNHMERVSRQQEEANDINSRTAVRVAVAVLRKVLPAACELHAFEEVTRVVEEVIGHILDEPRIIVRVAAELVEPVRGRLEMVAEAQGFEGRVVVQADPRLKAGDCRVEWTDGGAERDQTRLINDIEAAVERALAPPERRMAPAAEDGAEA